MILKSIKLKNFKKFQDSSFVFDEGLIGIIGNNGSGKSTIFEAIFYSLYGELKRKKDLIKNINSSSDVLVELVFLFNNKEYKVIRELRGKNLSPKAFLYCEGELIVSSSKEVTNFIIKLTKMNKDAFLNTLFASQKELTSLSKLGKEDRKTMIRKLLGLQKIDLVEKELIEIIRGLKKDIDSFREVLLSDEDINQKKTLKTSLNKKIESLILEQKKYNITLITKEIETITKTLQTLEEIKTTIQNITKEMEIIKKDISKDTTQLEKLKNELNNLKSKKVNQKVIDKYLSLEKKLQELNNLKNLYIKKQGLLESQEILRKNYVSLQNEIKALQEEIKEIAILNQSLKNLNIQEIENQKQIIEKKLKTIESQINQEKGIIEDIKTKIQNLQNLGKEATCPTCYRPLDKEYDNVISSMYQTIQTIQNEKIATLDKEYLDINKEFQTIQTSLKEKQTKEKEILNKLAILENKKLELTKKEKEFAKTTQEGLKNKKAIEELNIEYDENLHNQIEKEYNSLKDEYNQNLEIQTELKRIPILENEIKELNLSINQNTQKLNSFKLPDFNYKEYITLKEKLSLLQIKEKEYQKEINKIDVEIATLKGEIKTIEKILDMNSKQLKKLNNKKQDLEDYEKIKVSLNEFKTKINSQITPRISDIASEMFNLITKGRYELIEVDDNFEFYIYDEGKKFELERFSGGEIDLANLVLRIAISQTISEINGSNIEFLAFDEVFGSQDENRREEILNGFNLLKDKYKQIFLISHEIDIKEMFEKVIEL